MGYLVAFSSVALVFGIRMMLKPLTGAGAPYILFFGAVLLSSVLGDAGAGLLAVGLSAPLGAYFFVAKAGYSQSQSVFQALLFSLEAATIVYFASAFTAAKRESEIKSRALGSAKLELEEAIRARDEFLSIASHELKTPLTSLKLHGQFIRGLVRKGDDSVFTRKRIETLAEQTEKQAVRLERIVDDMLDIAWVRAETITLDHERFDLCALIREAAEEIGAQFLEAGCGVPTVLLCEEARGNWDRRRIRQVLGNLLTNAIKYGKGHPIEIEVDGDGDRVRLSVTDHGIGIAPAAQERIFNRFERAIPASEISGLGLGLYICRKIVSAHGGRIWVESRPGEGATFFVELPVNLNSDNRATVSRIRTIADGDRQTPLHQSSGAQRG